MDVENAVCVFLSRGRVNVSLLGAAEALDFKSKVLRSPQTENEKDDNKGLV